jgi:hypothetical protein
MKSGEAFAITQQSLGLETSRPGQPLLGQWAVSSLFSAELVLYDLPYWLLQPYWKCYCFKIYMYASPISKASVRMVWQQRNAADGPPPTPQVVVHGLMAHPVYDAHLQLIRLESGIPHICYSCLNPVLWIRIHIFPGSDPPIFFFRIRILILIFWPEFS